MKKTALAILIASITAAYSASANPNTVFSVARNQGFFKPLDLTPQFNEHQAFQLESGSFTFRVKTGSKLGSFFGAADPNSHLNYLSFYSMPGTNKQTFGTEIRTSSGNLIANDQIRTDLPVAAGSYHNVTYTFDKASTTISIYIDGVKKRSYVTDSKFFNDIPNLARAVLGETPRLTGNGYHSMRFDGEIYYADFDKRVLSEQEIIEKHQQLMESHNHNLSKREPFGAIKTAPISLFEPNQKGAKNYRIPSLFTTQDGVVIAAIDKRNQHASDWGNIDTAIRRSLDGGKTWQEDQVILDLAQQSYGDVNSAFLIDPLMVQDRNTGRLFMLVDMFPEMKGLFNFPAHGEGTGYKNIDGKQYRVLTDSNKNQYTVREGGIVYDEQHHPTEYRVVVEGDRTRAYQDLGDLYQGDTRLGNIFLNTKQSGHDSAPLTAKRTSYLWLIHSDDNGETWSNPVDITPQVKADWMQFLGTGPGNGIQLKNGNLVMPVYYLNNVGGLNSQSAAVIISKDGGQTWERGESPLDRWEAETGGSRTLTDWKKNLTESQVIELDNGELKMFSRNYVTDKVVISTSKDGGYTWLNTRQIDEVLLEPYSQLSVIKYSKKINGKEIVIFANPHMGGHPKGPRKNGKVWLGEVQEDGNIEWKYNTSITTKTEDYAYNSLTELPNGQIGLLYEGANGKINYVALNLQELVWHDNLIYRDSRDNDSPRDFALNSPIVETLYKVGDGEMIKVGQGANLAHLVVREGTATLNQQADNNNAKQAFQSVLVEQAGKVRLGSADQLPLDKLTLNKGTLDLNGNSLTLENITNAGLLNSTLDGHIVNENSETDATLTYQFAGDNHITGNLGSTAGKLNLHYQPTDASSSLTVQGNSVLNVVDVQSGSIRYVPNTQHQITQLNLAENTSLQFASNSVGTVNQSNLSANSRITIHANADERTQLTLNTTGAGNVEKQGDGVLQLSGNLAHSGKTTLQAGAMALNGTLANGQLEVHANTIFGGNADVQANTVLKAGSLVAPGFNQTDNTFAGKVVKFTQLVNEGAKMLLRVSHQDTTTQHDQLVVRGDVTSDQTIPVDVQFTHQLLGNTDSNRNGRYDVTEGLSLVQVLGQTDLAKFTLNQVLDAGKAPINLYRYALVSVDKAVSDTSQNQINGEKFFDFRLQTLLIDADGNSPEPVIRTVETPTTPQPPLTDAEIIKSLLEALKEKEAEYQQAVSLAEQLAKDKQATEQAKQAAEMNLQTALAEKATLEANLTNALANAKLNLKEVQNELALKQLEYQQAVALAQQLENDKQASEQARQEAVNARKVAEENLQNALEYQATLESILNTLPKSNPTVDNAKVYRAALHQKVPSYLVANHAMFTQADSVRRHFMENVRAEAKQGVYATHQAGNVNYRSHLGFSEYGYGYKAKQDSTLIGGFTNLGEMAELHLAVGFNRQTVTPKAADGFSSAEYKSTSFLVGLHKKWDNLLVNSVLGYHLQRGKVSTSSDSNIARVDGKQSQISSEVGYRVSLGQWHITPIVGLNYQHLASDITDHQAGWKVDSASTSVFSQHLGANASWQNDWVKLTLGTFYENNSKPQTLSVSAGNNKATFTTGKQSNDIVLKLNSEFSLNRHVSLGLQLERRHSVSKAKLSQSQIAGKLEYKF